MECRCERTSVHNSLVPIEEREQKERSAGEKMCFGLLFIIASPAWYGRFCVNQGTLFQYIRLESLTQHGFLHSILIPIKSEDMSRPFRL